MRQRRHALVVGIDGYPGRPLSGCCDDAVAMAELLRHHHDGTANWEVELVLGRSPRVPVVSSGALAGRLQRHFSETEDADILLYFSGHAVRSPLGVELSTQDGVRPLAGLPLDALMNLVQTATIDGARSVTVILDCCFAGELGSAVVGDGRSPLSVSQLPDNVVILTAAKPDQPATQAAAHSPFTGVLVQGLEGAAADLEGEVTALSLFQFAHRAAPARGPHPQLRATCDLMPTLRMAGPTVDAARLRLLADWFEAPAAVRTLDASWTWDGAPVTPGAELEQAEVLWQLRNAGLIEPVPRATLSWLAAHGGTVQLTHRGRFYWHLVAEGKL